jgi:formyl-CoA transferase
VPYDAFACRDGHVLIAVGNDAQFARFCDVLGMAEVAADTRFATNLGRIEHREPLVDMIATKLARLTTSDVLQKLHAVKVPAGPIHTVAQALGSDQAQARGTVVTVPAEDLAGGQLRLLANPLKLSRTPVQYRRTPPRFGQDTDAVLARFGWTPEKD